ncbi:MAG: hypothetical protein WDO16_07195 [Bacteroidota bacterium]
MIPNELSGYDLKPEFATQRQVETYFSKLPGSDHNEKLKLGIYDLISNVISSSKRDQETGVSFRISMEKTSSFRYLIPHIQHN